MFGSTTGIFMSCLLCGRWAGIITKTKGEKMSADMAKAVAKDPEVNVALDEQQKSIEYLSETIDRLWDKFKPVLRDEPNGVVLDEKEPQSTVPLVVNLKGKTRKIQNSNSRLRSILDLCEL